MEKGKTFTLNVDALHDYLSTIGEDDRDIPSIRNQKRYLDDDYEGAYCLSIDTDSTQPAGSGKTVAYSFETVCKIIDIDDDILTCEGEGGATFYLTKEEYEHSRA